MNQNTRDKFRADFSRARFSLVATVRTQIRATPGLGLPNAVAHLPRPYSGTTVTAHPFAPERKKSKAL